ncbi:MAG: acyl-[acyl-carrier-protein] thioesterase [Lachnospiraceae bacterium]|nr:acyl-[acyl-carrier-protein] thioesterase [Lachnospiraceae bacterium]
MYTYEINVGYSVLDESLHMTVPAILDCFQDAAIFEAENGSITVDYLYSRNIAWLLSSWQIVIDRRPVLNEKIKITTSPYDFRGFLGYRNFMVSDTVGDSIVRASSIWTLIDTAKLRPVKPTQEMIAGYELADKLNMDYAPRKIVLLADEDNAAFQEEFQVRKYQIDSNRHMNNVEYVRLAMETLSGSAEIRELRVEYRKPAVYGDRLTASVRKAQKQHQVALNDGAGDTYAVVEFKF